MFHFLKLVVPFHHFSSFLLCKCVNFKFCSEFCYKIINLFTGLDFQMKTFFSGKMEKVRCKI